MNPTTWEVWLAKVKYEDDPNTIKVRPVLVIDDQQCLYISLKMTTHEPRQKYKGEYQVIMWQQAGLDRPTVVRTSHILELQSSDFIKRLGKMLPIDITNILDILEKEA